MRRLPPPMFLVLLAAAVLWVPAAASDTVRGQVVAVHERVQTADGGVYSELTVRTRAREELRLRLGPASDGAPQYRVGDAIEARTAGPGPDGTRAARTVRNRSTGASERIRDGQGNLLRERDRTSVRARSQDRVHRPEPSVRGAGRGTSGRSRR